MSTIQDPRKTRLTTGSLLTVWWKIWSLWRLQQPLPSAGCCSPASLPPGREGPIGSRLALLWYSLNRAFCVWGYNFPRKIFFCLFCFVFCFVSLVIPRFGLLSHLSSLRLFSGHSCLVLTLRTDDAACAFLPSPNLLVANRSTWATSLLEVAISCIFCEFFSFFFPVMLLWEIPKLATGMPVRGFPTVWRLLLPDSLPRMDLHP